MRNVTKYFIVGMLAATAWISPAMATPITSALTGSSILSVNPSDYPVDDSVTAPGLTFAGGFNSTVIYGADQSYIDVPGAIILTFATPVSGFGFGFTANDTDLIVTAYDLFGRQLEQDIFAINGLPTPENFPRGYAGITSLSGIASASITTAIGSASVVIGTVSFTQIANALPTAALPENTTWTMMILGLAGVGVSLRRGRKFAFVAK